MLPRPVLRCRYISCCLSNDCITLAVKCTGSAPHAHLGPSHRRISLMISHHTPTASSSLQNANHVVTSLPRWFAGPTGDGCHPLQCPPERAKQRCDAVCIHIGGKGNSHPILPPSPPSHLPSNERFLSHSTTTVRLDAALAALRQ